MRLPGASAVTAEPRRVHGQKIMKCYVWVLCPVFKQALRPSGVRCEVGAEPAGSQPRDLIQGAWLLEQVSSARDDGQFVRACQLVLGLAVEAEDGFIVAADDEQRGRPYRAKSRASQVWPPAAGDDRCDRQARAGGGPQRHSGAGACAEVADREAAGGGMPAQPAGDAGQPRGEQPPKTTIGSEANPQL